MIVTKFSNVAVMQHVLFLNAAAYALLKPAAKFLDKTSLALQKILVSNQKHNISFSARA